MTSQLESCLSCPISMVLVLTLRGGYRLFSGLADRDLRFRLKTSEVQRFGNGAVVKSVETDLHHFVFAFERDGLRLPVAHIEHLAGKFRQAEIPRGRNNVVFENLQFDDAIRPEGDDLSMLFDVSNRVIMIFIPHKTIRTETIPLALDVVCKVAEGELFLSVDRRNPFLGCVNLNYSSPANAKNFSRIFRSSSFCSFIHRTMESSNAVDLVRLNLIVALTSHFVVFSV